MGFAISAMFAANDTTGENTKIVITEKKKGDGKVLEIFKSFIFLF